MTFRVGQKVACIKRGTWEGPFEIVNFPVYNGIYTIRAIDFFDEESWLQFEEIEIQLSPRGDQACFAARQFRPVVDKKTDIGFAREILRKVSRTKETAI